jgi:hypothetical protein
VVGNIDKQHASPNVIRRNQGVHMIGIIEIIDTYKNAFVNNGIIINKINKDIDKNKIPNEIGISFKTKYSFF